ncbi:MAG: type III restriction endonuclease subunit R [Candidatus Yonathbacteria bacterium CG_4_10_14_3_um_filter_47_65]|uniref:Type III restriction endonuclease subunit R n=2 Tax=Parcubacteria group TaxID=1794811 RepID=A0A2M8D5V9_9BACT|nr:MAG: type III restriction endonuclease subunit R [Candidatus Nomurabacteria bacterium CG1_02_47_685]PIP03242.1 MAG: type III restriction endonuclease subunit R [Candidatus Yonathbacteria bacterium CG23_combo_of_CG06-09_8_20_14_all_46_18]PIQ32130.1 MAG: type III restriction endonuclease subunit R [Candidatus Yonathbacteria bacterium CG17_big_fil_post_rev_8_21_14_2_50_46_19]PIX56203.1 MAG: type III restriction endonuclease subunit R [Candidatus Yonathbacteria bacterium CG_4_10_14_3_um_filter_47
MALHKDFPKDPYEILDPNIRWFPADEALREKGFDKLVPPLVADLRKKVKEWRDKNYEGASDTSKSLLNWWFKEEHILYDQHGTSSHFKYYFAQREAMETVVWLYEVAKVKDKYDLIRYNSTGVLSPQMFTEDWLRFVIKMATGAGKTKVMSLVVAWAYFHKKYEEDSNLAKNFLLITPNVIVFERIKHDFERLKIFFSDPVLPDNGYHGQNWQDDFQMTLHLQDDLRNISDTGNIFLTNIHRVFEGDVREASAEDEDASRYFLGEKPVTKTSDSTVDLGMIVRDIDELIVINDEGHHVKPETAWYKSIEDINNKLIAKGVKLSLHLDLSATPKDDDGNIFVQIISDYPLVEAIHQEIVKTPVIPDVFSQGKLKEKQSIKFSERYRDHINLAIEEWRKTYKEHKKVGKKAILFIMTDDTKNCDEVAKYVETNFTDLKGAVLTIHTKNNGEIRENATGRNKEELDLLRKQANEIDSWESPFKVIISVMMLKEGWDVKNVTTILGLKPFTADNKILPEQALGRGLRRMYFGQKDIQEEVAVIGNQNFMDFVESIKGEGVILEKKAMGTGAKPIAPMVIEVDKDNPKKDIEKLDIEIPVMSPRIQREYKNLAELDVSKFGNKKVKVKTFSEEEVKQIVFKEVISEKISHTIDLTGNLEPDYQSVVGFFAQAVMRELRLFGCYDILFGKVREFVQNNMFDSPVNLSDLNTLRNLSEVEHIKLIKDSFKKAINDLTVEDKGDTEIKNYIKISEARPFVVNDKSFVPNPKKSVFNKIVGDSNFELEFAGFLEDCEDVISYAKNFQNKEASALRIEYKNSEGFIATYYPDFFVKKDKKTVYIVETKGREEDDDKLKFERLQRWCEDVNNRQNQVVYKALYIKQEEWEKDKLKNFDEVARVFSLK